jgi:hypothetical protein
MKTIKKEIFFRSNSYSETENIHSVELQLSDETIKNIQKAQDLIKANNFIFSINVEKMPDDKITLLNDEDNITDDWKVGIYLLRVYADTVYYCAECKYDSADQIESDGISLDELK